ncbi:MAG TPA: ABC transporter permease, partial [Nitriliruptorales bacterium]
LIAMAFLFGLAYSGISLTIALRTGSAEATQASFIIFFPLVFLAPTFVPIEFLPGWLQAVVAVNPVTYIIVGLRALTVHGFQWGEIGWALVAIVLIGGATLGSAFRALKVRTNQ